MEKSIGCYWVAQALSLLRDQELRLMEEELQIDLQTLTSHLNIGLKVGMFNVNSNNFDGDCFIASSYFP